MVYYEKDNILIRDSIPKDIIYLRYRMRQSDKDEIWASHHKMPLEALLSGYKESLKCITGLVNNKAVVMFGIVPVGFLGNKASIWLLGTDELKCYSKTFIKQSRIFIKKFLEYYSMLCNYVDDRNLSSIQWLRLCGAEIGEPQIYGVDKMNFRYFCFRRK